MIERSTGAGVTGVVAVDVLLFPSGSAVVEVTSAVLTIGPTALTFTFITNWNVALAPRGRVAILQVIVVVPLHANVGPLV